MGRGRTRSRGIAAGTVRRAAAVFALGVAVASAAAAAPLPPRSAGPDRADPDVAETAAAVAVLVRVGLDPEAARAHVARLSREERRRLTGAGESLGVGGAHWSILGVLGGTLVVLLLVLALVL